MFRGFEEGAEAFRPLEQGGAAPDVARLSDEAETRLSLQLAGGGSLAQRAGRALHEARAATTGGCLAILGFEGERTDVRGAGARRRPASCARQARSRSAAGPGRAWERGRYDGPYLRDALLDNGVMVETLETAARVVGPDGPVRGRRGSAPASRSRRAARPPLVMCHVSHLYPNGASLYFTFIAAQEEGAELEQWRAAKSAACDAIVGSGGTITHHHAIGRDHAPWMPREIGELGVELLAVGEAAARPGRHHEPGQAAAGTASRVSDLPRASCRSSRRSTARSASRSLERERRRRPRPHAGRRTGSASPTGSCTAAR